MVQLEPVWNLASWLRILVEEWDLNDDLLDTLIEAVQWAVNTVSDDLAKQKLKKWLDAMRKMKEIEEESREEDEKELVELDRIIQSF